MKPTIAARLREFLAQSKSMGFKDADPPKYLILMREAAEELERLTAATAKDA